MLQQARPTLHTPGSMQPAPDQRAWLQSASRHEAPAASVSAALGATLAASSEVPWCAESMRCTWKLGMPNQLRKG